MEVTKQSAWIEALTVSKPAFLAGRYGLLFSWDDVPVYWFQWASEAGLLSWEKGEKIRRINAAIAEAKNEGLKTDSQIEARARVIRQKRVVWEKVIRKNT